MSDLRRTPTPDGGLVPPPVSEAASGPRPEVESLPRTELERLVSWADERTGLAEYARPALRKVFPDHWSFLLGEVALFCLIILVLTGTFMTLFFRPDLTPTVYEGSYAPLRGETVSAAYNSVLNLSFDVRFGLIFRQIHHWTALLFIAVITLHMSRIFFTGAFRRPREINWLIGFSLLIMALAEGFTGYSLPDDLLSGEGLRIFYSVFESIPFIGPWLMSLLFDGVYPTQAIDSRLFILHVMLLPGLFLGAVGVHLLLVWIQKHTQYPGPGKTEHNVVGQRFWPGQVFRSTGLFFLTAALVSLIAGLFQINPIWIYGPYIPYASGSPAQPDWYIGWLEGALRTSPNLEVTILGVTIPSIFWPGVVLPGLLFTPIILWPFIEPHITHDFAEHNLLDMPWDKPFRTATGVAVLSIFVVLTLAGGNDVLAVYFHVALYGLTNAFRLLLIAVPIVAWITTYVLMKERKARGKAPLGPAAGTALRRLPDGGFEEVEV